MFDIIINVIAWGLFDWSDKLINWVSNGKLTLDEKFSIREI